MKANETTLKDLLEGKRQYRVPLYQRRYSWTKAEWLPFWASVERQYELLRNDDGKNRPAHFFGSLVIHPVSTSASAVSAFDIIDGQQRMTTVALLLCALRDQMQAGDARDELHETYLVNKYQREESKYRIRLGEHDRTDMYKIIDGKPQDATGSVGAAYAWLTNRLQLLKEESQPNWEMLQQAIISRLQVVDVTIDVNDNAHRIFQTLNSTGRRLTSVDLLRNHFFMLLPSRTEDAYKALWAPMEARLGDRLEFFLWVDLVSRGGGRETISTARVYPQWQSDLEKVEHDESLVFSELEDLHRRALSYKKIVTPSGESDGGVRAGLVRLQDWGSNVHHPVSQQVMLRFDSTALNAEQATRALRLIESFMVRRMLVRIPTNNLNRIFTTVAGRLAELGEHSDYVQKLHLELSGAAKYWPRDEDVRSGTEHEDFFHAQRPAQRQFVLRRLEEALPGPERPDWQACSYTVEHIMPQHLTEEWRKSLQDSGETDPFATHAELVHTLGNLTLTCENPKLSDHPLQRKKEILGDSVLKLNREIKEASTWTRKEITERARRLGKMACDTWPAPLNVGQTEDPSTTAAALSAVCGSLPNGQWISIEDLAEVTDESTETISALLISSSVDGKERVLRSDGTFETGFPWVQNSLSHYKQQLVAAGVLESTEKTAAPQEGRATLEWVISAAEGA